MNKKYYATTLILGILSITGCHFTAGDTNDHRNLPTNKTVQTTPSFDCAKATTEVEKLICSDDELAKINKCEIYTFLNCKKINNQIDDLTCSDAKLLKLYKKMQKKYFELCKSLSNKDERIKLYKDQVEWLDKQKSADYMGFGAYNRRIFYLKEAYQEKINDLEFTLEMLVLQKKA